MNLTTLNFSNFKQEHISALWQIDDIIDKGSYRKFERILENKQILCFSFSYDIFGWTDINDSYSIIDTEKFINLHTKLNNLLR